jgi:hypothetical protein
MAALFVLAWHMHRDRFAIQTGFLTGAPSVFAWLQRVIVNRPTPH